MDTILRSHSGINIVEEEPLLKAAENFLQKRGYTDFIGQTLPEDLNIEARKIYLDEFKNHIDTIGSNKIQIDKLPLNLLKAPLIHQLFSDGSLY